MLPLTYAIRNLLRSFPRTLQMVFGAVVVVVLIMSAEAFNRGMDAGLKANGNPRNVLLMAAGSEESLERSQISASVPGIVAAGLSGLKHKLDQPAISPEVHYSGLITLDPRSEVNHEIIFRGITPGAFMVHPQVEILKGTFPAPGEVMAGRMTYKYLGIPQSDLNPGRAIYFGNEELKISGLFQAPGTLMESEIWINSTDLMDLTRRKTYSCIVLTMDSLEYDDVDYFCKQRLDLELSAVPEPDYYGRMSNFFQPIKYMTWLTALLITIGAAFGSLNTMYAAYISRRKEMATLQALGYSRRAIYFSLLEEALIASLIGTIIAMATSVFFLNGITVSFSTGVFYLNYDTDVLLLAMAAGMGLAILGTTVPGWNSLKPSLVSSLRS